MDTAEQDKFHSAEFRGRVYDSIVETIGDTPLVRLNRMPQAHGCKAEILGKCEFFNPSLGQGPHSIVDGRGSRATGPARPGGTIVEPTSGNTGIALAFVCAAKGYRLILTMPESMSIERRKMLRFSAQSSS